GGLAGAGAPVEDVVDAQLERRAHHGGVTEANLRPWLPVGHSQQQMPHLDLVSGLELDRLARLDAVHARAVAAAAGADEVPVADQRAPVARPHAVARLHHLAVQQDRAVLNGQARLGPALEQPELEERHVEAHRFGYNRVRPGKSSRARGVQGDAWSFFLIEAIVDSERWPSGIASAALSASSSVRLADPASPRPE